MGQLSGGQQLRVYACSVVEYLHRSTADAAILVLDETLDGLNPEGAGAFIDGIAAAWTCGDNRPLYLLLVTHLPSLAATTPEVIRVELQVIDEGSSHLRVEVRCLK
jgi:ABC-type Mn2+/Zn2+ transport system ATPase subunit